MTNVASLLSTGQPADDLLAAAHRVFLELRTDVDSIADEVFARLIEEIPLAGVLPGDVLADVREKMVETIVLALDHMATRASLAPLTARVRAVAVERASAGIPLEVTILAHEIAADVLTDVGIERLAADGVVDAALLGHVMRRAMGVLQAVTMGVAAGYEQRAVTAALSRQHDHQALLEALLADRPADDLLARVQRDGVDTRFQWAVATPGTGSAEPPFPQRHPAALVGELDGRAVLLSAEPLNELPPNSGFAAVEDAGPGAALRRALDACRVAVHAGLSRMNGTMATPFNALLSLPASDRDDYVRATLGPLGQPGGDDELLLTLVRYLASGLQRVATARVLHVHRHTLDRRLARIDQLLPVDLGDPAARLDVQLALFLLGRFPAE